jgi:hypothetical protein
MENEFKSLEIPVASLGAEPGTDRPLANAGSSRRKGSIAAMMPVLSIYKTYQNKYLQEHES